MRWSKVHVCETGGGRQTSMLLSETNARQVFHVFGLRDNLLKRQVLVECNDVFHFAVFRVRKPVNEDRFFNKVQDRVGRKPTALERFQNANVPEVVLGDGLLRQHLVRHHPGDQLRLSLIGKVGTCCCNLLQQQSDSKIGRDALVAQIEHVASSKRRDADSIDRSLRL